jgi:hypothetical protein
LGGGGKNNQERKMMASIAYTYSFRHTHSAVKTAQHEEIEDNFYPLVQDIGNW